MFTHITGFCIVICTTIWSSVTLDFQLQNAISQGGGRMNQFKEKHRTNILVRYPPRNDLNGGDNRSETITWGLPEPTDAKNLLGINRDEADGFIGKFMERIFRQGIERFKKTAMYLKICVEKEGKDFYPDLKKAIDNYVLQLKLYYRHILVLNSRDDINEDMILIDMIDSTTKLFYNMQRKVLHAFTKKTNATLTVDLIKFVTDAMYKDMTESKKRGFQYICDYKDICKVYPGFTDSLADMITEILKFPHHKLVRLREIVTDQVSKRKDVVAMIVTDKDYTKLVEMGKILAGNNIFYTKTMLRRIRTMIIKRHKLVDTKVATSKLKKIKAKRMLLDMIDKVFEADGEDEVTITFAATERGLRQWVYGLRKNIEKLVRHFVNYVIEMCRFDWDLKTREEIKLLNEAILNEKTKNESLLKNLFLSGSDYLKRRVGGLFNLPLGLK